MVIATVSCKSSHYQSGENHLNVLMFLGSHQFRGHKQSFERGQQLTNFRTFSWAMVARFLSAFEQSWQSQAISVNSVLMEAMV